LLLNYAGQAAVAVDGGVAEDANLFFVLCPPVLQVPLVALATVATVIASQSIISGTFSMTRQAIQLGLCPRLHITQTSSEGYGQIYVGFVNWTLMALTLGLALTFRSSENLASAFGIAVALTMLLTSLLMFLAMREVWGWSLPLSIAVAGLFTIVDLSFVAANMMKVFEGGWVPLVVGATLYFAMSTWRQGRTALLRKLERDTMPLGDFIAQVHGKPRVPGTAVYLTSRLDVCRFRCCTISSTTRCSTSASCCYMSPPATFRGSPLTSASRSSTLAIISIPWSPITASCRIRMFRECLSDAARRAFSSI